VRWLRAWRLPFRLARRDVRRRPGRSVLVALLVALPVTALSLLAIGYRTTLRDDDAWVVREFGTADAVADLGLDCECDRRTPLEDTLPPGTQIVWGTEADLPVTRSDRGESNFALVTTIDMSNPLLKGRRDLAQGRWPDSGREVALDRQLAERYEVGIGDQLQLVHQRTTFVIVGLIDGNNEYAPMIAAPGFDFDLIRPSFKSDVGFIDFADSFDGSLPLQINPNPESSFGYGTSNDGLKTTLAWLGAVLAMSVLGVLIAAAFAVSGRRQLATLGQLSASGVDQRTIVRALTLQGTVTGVVGAGVGLLAAAAIHSQSPNMFGLHGPAVVSSTDMVLLFATSVVIATIAALIPARSLRRVAVLSAMAGRRPIGVMSRRHALRGALLFIGGLSVTTFGMRSATGMAAVLLAALGMMAVIFGVCALSALLLEKLSALAANAGGALRLGARSTGRSGPRAASVFASMVLVGMIVTGVGALAEHNATGDFWDDHGDRGDLFWVSSIQTTVDPASGSWIDTPITSPSPAEIRQQAEDVVGEVAWTSVAAAYRDRPADAGDPNSALTVGPQRWLVASDGLLDLLNISVDRRAILQQSPTGVEFVHSRSRSARDPEVPIIVESQLAFGFSWSVITPEAASELGLSVVPSAVEFGVADSDLHPGEIEALQALSRSDLEGMYYSGSEPVGEVVTWQVARLEPESRLLAHRVRIGVILGALLLVGLLVLIGMSLMSVEGRNERDLLIAVGAAPAAVARIAGWRAGGLTFAAMAISVPVGLATAWLIFSNAHVPIAVPGLLAGLLILVLPATAGLVAFVSSAVAQRLRPLRSSSLAED
jgi:putative ABC transport system permease protein